MNEIFIVERHIVLLNGAAAIIPIRAFSDKAAAVAFQGVVEAEMKALFACPVYLAPGVTKSVSSTLGELGLKGVAHGIAPTGLQSGVIEAPGGPRIIM